MKVFIGEYDKTEAFLALIKILEIKGKNKLIDKLQNDVILNFKNEFGDSSLSIECVIPLVIKAREDAIEAAKLNSNN